MGYRDLASSVVEIDASREVPPRPALSRATRLSIIGASLAGALLRLWHIGRQVIGGDEWHALRVAIRRPWPEILTTFHAADNCIPLTAFYRSLIDLGVPLSETWIRLPPLLAGLLMTPLLALSLARRVDGRTAAFFAWLLALSPELALYARIARPYAPVTLLVGVAVLAADRFLAERRLRDGALYCATAALATWFLPPVLPAAGAPLVAALVDIARRRPARWRREVAQVGALSAGLAAAGLLLIGPALSSLLELVAAKRVAQTVPLRSWAEVAQLHAGSGEPAVAALVWATAILGLILLGRREPSLAVLVGTVWLVQVVGLCIVSPLGLSNPVILARYLLPVLPLVLACVAVTLATAWRRSPPWRLVAFLACGAWVAANPLWRPAYRRSSFVGHTDLVRFTLPAATAELPPCYARLAHATPGPVFEAPWPYEWTHHVPAIAERDHGRPVILGEVDPLPGNGKLALRTVGRATPEAALASSAAIAIVHDDPMAEERAVEGAGRPPRRSGPLVFAHQLRKSEFLARFRLVLGEPLCDDGRVAVWDLTRARIAREPTAGQPPG